MYLFVKPACCELDFVATMAVRCLVCACDCPDFLVWVITFVLINGFSNYIP